MEKKVRAIADHYGLQKQLGIAQEECGELIAAISKLNRATTEGDYRVRQNALIGEIADVAIMAMQLSYLIDDEAVGTEIDKKLDRQLLRIAREQKHGSL